MNILNVGEQVYVDNSITSYEYHTYQPYSNTSLGHNDEIRIPIQGQDLITLPSQSFLVLEGKLSNEKGETSPVLKFVNNGLFSLFDEIRYELGGTVIERNRNPIITSTLKGYTSFSPSESVRFENAGWLLPTKTENPIIDEKGEFNVWIPLSMLLGFAEDFKKIIINIRQELILIRSSSDLNAITSGNITENPKIVLKRIQWRVPHIALSDVEKLKLYNQIENRADLNIPFRCWELHEMPQVPQTDRHSWTIKSSNQLEKPRYVLFAFQTDRKNNAQMNASHFDHCNLSNIRLFLNSEVYPYDNLNVNYENNQKAILYEMFAKFQQSYYYKHISEPCLTPVQYFKIAPIVTIDCSHQNEVLRSGSAVDVRVEIETSKAIPAKTSAYCLILHDRLIKYNPLTGLVKII